MKNGKTEKEGKRSEKTVKYPGVRRLLLANAAALLALIAVTLTVLVCLGLFDSVWASLFPAR